jgi:hypothetical protein
MKFASGLVLGLLLVLTAVFFYLVSGLALVETSASPISVEWHADALWNGGDSTRSPFPAGATLQNVISANPKYNSRTLPSSTGCARVGNRRQAEPTRRLEARDPTITILLRGPMQVGP